MVTKNAISYTILANMMEWCKIRLFFYTVCSLFS